jgi:tetratricopeptide (TPR) repeat protein
LTAAINYQNALRLDPQNPELYNKLGIAQLKLDNRGAARKSFNQAVKHDPRNTTALNNLGALALLDKKYKPALRYLKEALALDESNSSAHLNMAGVWMGMNQLDRAMTEYSRALELNPDLLTDDEGGLIAQVRTPEQRARISYLIAKAYAKRGNLDGALDYLRRAKADRFPNMANVYTDQEFAPLWADPRLAKIVKR